MAVFTKKGKRFDTTGRPLYGPVPTNNVFRGFGGSCESRNNGDAVVRYDQIADRWLIVMPVFSRAAERPDQPGTWKGGEPAYVSPPGRPGQPGPAVPLFQPPRAPSGAPTDAAAQNRAAGRRDESPRGPYSMCYAVSTSSDPLGSYFRYEFLRPLFPDYPRPAIWSDGYYVPTSTSDDRISEHVATQKHACVADRARMLEGKPATEQCVIVENVNFLNNADIDGRSLPPSGAPNVMLAAGGTQLDELFEADTIDAWQFHVDWKSAAKTKVSGPKKIRVAPYRYLCDGQLSNCVPQPGIERRLDAQGDKLMARVAYRRIGSEESIVAVHSVNTTAGGGWCPLVRIPDRRDARRRAVSARHVRARQVLPLAGESRDGSTGQHRHRILVRRHASFRRTAVRRAASRGSARFPDPWRNGPGRGRSVAGRGAVGGLHADRGRPSDDCTIWYVGDYLRKGVETYSSRIGAFRMAGCNVG
jgi:hypothetical protein